MRVKVFAEWETMWDLLISVNSGEYDCDNPDYLYTFPDAHTDAPMINRPAVVAEEFLAGREPPEGMFELCQVHLVGEFLKFHYKGEIAEDKRLVIGEALREYLIINS